MYTNKKYWTDYYSGSEYTKEKIISICSQYDRFWDILIKSCQTDPKTILEIGAYPGRYISYFAWKYNIYPTAVDFNPDKETIKKSFELMSINNYEIISEDFIKWNAGNKYDLIISIGFIEHFEDYNTILDKHVYFLNEGGALFISIPNKRGLRRLYGLICDRENLKRHNLECMDTNIFKKFALRNNLKIDYLEYYGGFQHSVHQKLNIVQSIIYRIVRYFSLRFKIYIEENPSWIYSAGIIGIFSKVK